MILGVAILYLMIGSYFVALNNHRSFVHFNQSIDLDDAALFLFFWPLAISSILLDQLVVRLCNHILKGPIGRGFHSYTILAVELRGKKDQNNI